MGCERSDSVVSREGKSLQQCLLKDKNTSILERSCEQSVDSVLAIVGTKLSRLCYWEVRKIVVIEKIEGPNVF